MKLTYHALKHRTEKLIYVPTLKVASRYFVHYLSQNDFVPIPFEEIDWKEMYAFSHIMHPIKRRNKGVAEFFNYAVDIPNDQLLQGAESFPNMLQILQAPYFDQHSAPLHLLYEGFIEHIHFIPIDLQQVDYIDHTQKLLQKYGITIDFSKNKIHESMEPKIQMYNIVVAHMKSSIEFSDVIMGTFRKDIELYEKIATQYTSTT